MGLLGCQAPLQKGAREVSAPKIHMEDRAGGEALPANRRAEAGPLLLPAGAEIKQGLTQVSSGEINLVQRDATEVGPSQVGTPQSDRPQAPGRKSGFPKIHAGKILILQADRQQPGANPLRTQIKSFEQIGAMVPDLGQQGAVLAPERPFG
jgi:hypothetical protein